ncbi:hypothetical protein EYF80_024115 [Liparis tanakae]|uniref:Uncharacterized protein n=1 Tax=Liparis tanakae TaxID=230148 RepID=A0A4Z2HIG2_9TELE|nr:hypothetical protein EYF80_024115 [Liparis tanakae]
MMPDQHFLLITFVGSGRQSVVVVLPAIETLEPDFGAAPQQPLCGGPVGTDGFDPVVVHTERRTTTTTLKKCLRLPSR